MPRANRRRDKHDPIHELPLEDCNGFHVRKITAREARQGVNDGTYKPIYAKYRMGTPSDRRELIGVRLATVRFNTFRPVVPITRGEADAAVGLHGESRTMRLSDFHKALRVQRIRDEQNKIVAEEDHIERAMIKIAFYPVVGDERNPATVGPRVDQAALAQFVGLQA
jgi:hypothetical protein